MPASPLRSQATLKDIRVADTLHCSIYTCDIEQTRDYTAACPLRIVDYTPPPSSFDQLPLRVHAELRRALPFVAEVKDEVRMGESAQQVSRV
jgi:hypothetical protein